MMLLASANCSFRLSTAVYLPPICLSACSCLFAFLFLLSRPCSSCWFHGFAFSILRVLCLPFGVLVYPHEPKHDQALRTLVEIVLLGKEDQRRLMTDVIQHATGDEASAVEVS